MGVHAVMWIKQQEYLSNPCSHVLMAPSTYFRRTRPSGHEAKIAENEVLLMPTEMTFFS